MDLSIIIVNYNVREFLEQALNSIKKAVEGVDTEIFVVDNNSHDGSVRMLREKYPEVILIANKKNTGFALANNQAVRISKGKFLLLINPDTIVKEDTFTKMLDFFREHPDAGLAGCKILNPDGTLQLACRRSIPTPFIAFTRLFGLSRLFPKSKLFGRYNLTYLDPDETTEVEAVSGSFMMVRKTALDEVGLLDEQFFMYGEDLDWMYRFSLKGWKIYYVPATSIIHFKGESAKKSRFDPLLAFYRSMDIFVHKHYKDKYGYGSFFLIRLAILFQAVISFSKYFSGLIFYPLIDLLFINAALISAIILRFNGFVPLPVYYDWRSYFIVLGIPSAIIMTLLFKNRIYSKFPLSAGKTLSAVFWGAVVISSLTFFFNSYAFSRLAVIYFTLICMFLLTGWRLLIRLIKGFTKVSGLNIRNLQSFSHNTIIVGDLKNCLKVFKKLKKHGYTNIKLIVPDLKDEKTPLEVDGTPLIEPDRNLYDIITEQKIREVIFAAPLKTYDKIIEVSAFKYSEDVQFKLIPDSMEVLIGKSSIDRIENLPVIDIELKINDPFNRILKRLFDIIVASFYLFIYFISFCTVLLFKRPKLKKEQYLTLYSEVFQIREPEKDSDRFARKVCRYLKMWHVFKGNLSIVGGMWIKSENEKSSNVILAVKSGIINLTSGLEAFDYNGSSSHNAELYYMQNFSLFLDMQIINRYFKKHIV